jgi:hypothetical protein
MRLPKKLLRGLWWLSRLLLRFWEVQAPLQRRMVKIRKPPLQMLLERYPKGLQVRRLGREGRGAKVLLLLLLRERLQKGQPLTLPWVTAVLRNMLFLPGLLLK